MLQNGLNSSSDRVENKRLFTSQQNTPPPLRFIYHRLNLIQVLGLTAKFSIRILAISMYNVTCA